MMAARFPATRKGWAVAVLGLAILLVAADTLVWFHMQRQLDRRLDGLVRKAAHAGWQLQIASGHRGGWPFAASLTLAAPRLHGADELVPGGLTWSGDEVTAAISLLHPARMAILPRGTQMMSVGHEAVAERLRFWSADSVLLLYADGDGGTGSVPFKAQALHVAFPGAGPDDVLTAAGLSGTLRWAPGARALTLALEDVGLPHGTGAAAAGNIILKATLDVSLIGALGSGGLADRLQAWRSSGGHVLLRQAGLDWSGARIEASGQASLDATFQPDGAFSVRVEGVDALLRNLTRTGRLTSGSAGVVRAVLGLVAAARDNPGTAPPASAERPLPPVDLPLTLRGGLLSLGQIPLLRIPLGLPPGPATPP